MCCTNAIFCTAGVSLSDARVNKKTDTWFFPPLRPSHREGRFPLPPGEGQGEGSANLRRLWRLLFATESLLTMPWHMAHPGRSWALELELEESAEDIIAEVRQHLVVWGTPH